MKRSAMKPRREPIARSGPIKSKPRKPRTPEQRAERQRKQDEKFARGFGDDARVRWIKYVLPCVGCGRLPNYDFPNDNAHTANEGKSRKGHHSTIAPLCATSIRGLGCHTKYDRWLAPFDREDRREAIRLAAAFTNAEWVLMGERGRERC